MSSLLAGLDEAEGFDARACACYVGTSAGSIVAASLAAGLAPGARLGELTPAADAGAAIWSEHARDAAAPGVRHGGRARRRRSRAVRLAGLRLDGSRRSAAATHRAATRARRAALAGRARPHGRAGRRALGRAPAESPRWSSRADVGSCSARPVRRRPRCRSPCRLPARFRACSSRCASTGATTSTAARGARPTWTPRRSTGASARCA